MPQNPGFAVAPPPSGGGSTYAVGGGYNYQGGGMQNFAPANTGPPVATNLPQNIGQKSGLASSTAAPAFDPNAKSFKPCKYFCRRKFGKLFYLHTSFMENW